MRNSVTDEAKNKFLIENKEAADGDGDWEEEEEESSVEQKIQVALKRIHSHNNGLKTEDKTEELRDENEK
jgi:hypothetical protein